MALNFPEMGEDRLPPEETRIRELLVEPYPDGRRIKLTIELTPFQERPNMDIEVEDPQGARAASASVIECMDFRMSLTMHLRGEVPAGRYTARADLSFEDHGQVDQKEVVFELPHRG